MKAIILAAGRGSRLKGFSEDKPKCLNLVGDSTILSFQLRAFSACGIERVVIVTGYKSDMLKGFGTLRINNARWEQTNMVASLLCAEPEFKDGSLVSYADIIYGQGTVSELMKQDKDIVLSYDPNWLELWQERFPDPLTDAESFVIDNEGRISDIGRKVESIDEIQGQYMGLLYFSAKGFSWIKDIVAEFTGEEVDRMDMTTLLSLLIKKGYPVYGVPIKESWCEIDNIGDLNLANRLYGEKLVKG